MKQIIEIKRFIEKIKLSEHRRTKYYKYKDKIPKKYRSEAFSFDKNGFLIETSTNTRIIKNTRTAGTPNVRIITGQYFWQGAHPHIRRKIKKEMSDFFAEYLQQFTPIKKNEYPIGVRIDLYDSIDEGTNQDIDNFMFLYRKVIHDVLTGGNGNYKKIIIDDSKKYIQEINSRFFPILNHENRKLVIKIYSLNNN